MRNLCKRISNLSKIIGIVYTQMAKRQDIVYKIDFVKIDLREFDFQGSQILESLMEARLLRKVMSTQIKMRGEREKVWCGERDLRKAKKGQEILSLRKELAHFVVFVGFLC